MSSRQGNKYWANFPSKLKSITLNILEISSITEQKQKVLKKVYQVITVSEQIPKQTFVKVCHRINDVLETLQRQLNHNGQIIPVVGFVTQDQLKSQRLEALKIMGDSHSVPSSRNLTDEQLFEAVRIRRFANPQHLAELLNRTDISLDLMQQVRVNLSEALNSERFFQDDLQRVISQLNSANSSNRFDEVLAELRYPNRLIRTGEVAVDSGVILGATQGREYVLGSVRVRTDPVPDVDVLYLGKERLVRIDEVKNTANALREKLNKTPEQLRNMQRWLAEAPTDRKITVVIEQEDNWTDLFAIRKKGETAALRILIDERVPLTIGSYNLSVSKMNELWNAVLIKSQELKMFPPKSDFFSQIPTLNDAERFLGISLK
ncbi:hypothetical protein [Scytonema sp. NUACC26]|uniref:hypothetical protein n=1 Tax=Scytonema sp. NUACC26 TaxID=3140176 RepID=UPI0034DC80FD